MRGRVLPLSWAGVPRFNCNIPQSPIFIQRRVVIGGEIMPKVMIYVADWCALCRSTIRRIVPQLSEEDIEYVVVDVGWHPNDAKERDIEHLPTICVVDSGENELMRCRGCPTDEVLEKIIELCIEGD